MEPMTATFVSPDTKIHIEYNIYLSPSKCTNTIDAKWFVVAFLISEISS